LSQQNVYGDAVSHVLPVSDDGGSTAEIVRVLGGPAVGDIRSRCLRLADSASTEARAVKALLGHRLSAHDRSAAKTEWYNIVEGEHQLWQGIGEPYKHTIRAFLVHFHTLVLKQSTTSFSFQNGSVGTLPLSSTAAQVSCACSRSLSLHGTAGSFIPIVQFCFCDSLGMQALKLLFNVYNNMCFATKSTHV
jgi:2-phospho-L-lactate transferase CofD